MSLYDYVKFKNHEKMKKSYPIVTTSRLNTMLKGEDFRLVVYVENAHGVYKPRTFNREAGMDKIIKLYMNNRNQFSDRPVFPNLDEPLKGKAMHRGKTEKSLFNNNRFVWEIDACRKDSQYVVNQIRVKSFAFKTIQVFQNVEDFLQYLKTIVEKSNKEFEKQSENLRDYLKKQKRNNFIKRFYSHKGSSFDTLLIFRECKNVHGLKMMGTRQMCMSMFDGMVEFRSSEEHLREPLWKLAIDYQIKHKDSLLQLDAVLKQYQINVHQLTNINPLNLYTIGAVSYNHILNKLPKNTMIYQNIEFENMCREGLKGGGHNHISQTFFKDREMWLHAMDFVSQYPSAMYLFPYPVGECCKITNPEMIRDRFNKNKYENLGIFRVDLKCEEECLVPITHEKIGRRTEFNFNDRKGVVMTSVAIQDAIQYNNYMVTKVYSGYEWKCRDFIFDFVKDIFEWKYRATIANQGSLKNVGKVLLNAMFGGLGRRPILEKTELVDEERYEQLFDTNGISILQESIQKGKILLKYEKPMEEDDIDRPVYLCLFIVDYSKRMMNQVTEMFEGFTREDQQEYYRDTDCLVVNNKVFDILKSKKIKYPRMDYEIPVIGDGMGQMNDDLKQNFERKIVRAYIPAKKTKCFILDDGTMHYSLKGLDYTLREQLDDNEIEKIFIKMFNGEKTTFKVDRIERNNLFKGESFGVQSKQVEITM